MRSNLHKTWHLFKIQIHKEVISDLNGKVQILSQEIWEPIRFISREREICKPVLKVVFTALGIMESLSEFGLRVLWVLLSFYSKYTRCFTERKPNS
jgi:hypothetical protein